MTFAGLFGSRNGRFALGARLHPDVFDAEPQGLVDNLLRNRWRCDDRNGIDRFRHRGETRRDAKAFDFIRVGVDRRDVVVVLKVRPQDLVAVLGSILRGTDDGESLAGKKSPDLVLFGHGVPSAESATVVTVRRGLAQSVLYNGGSKRKTHPPSGFTGEI